MYNYKRNDISYLSYFKLNIYCFNVKLSCFFRLLLINLSLRDLALLSPFRSIIGLLNRRLLSSLPYHITTFSLAFTLTFQTKIEQTGLFKPCALLY